MTQHNDTSPKDIPHTNTLAFFFVTDAQAGVFAATTPSIMSNDSSLKDMPQTNTVAFYAAFLVMKKIYLLYS
jgi:hypothetical protein